MHASSKTKKDVEPVPSGDERPAPATTENAEQAAAVPIIECPPELDAAARQKWDRIIGDITATGMITTFDRAALAVYCQAYALWIDALEHIKTYGTVMKSPTGYPMLSPYLTIANRQVDTMLRVATEFGFTPASRGLRLSMPRSDSSLLDSEHSGPGLKELGDVPELSQLKW